MKAWLNQWRLALFGGRSRRPENGLRMRGWRDYPSKRRWLAQRIVPLLIQALRAVCIRPLERLEARLERLSLIELAHIEAAAKAVLGEDFVRLEHKRADPRHRHGESATVNLYLARPLPGRLALEDAIRRHYTNACPALGDAGFALWLPCRDDDKQSWTWKASDGAD